VVRALIRALDRLLRRASGVLDFTDDPECLLRLQIASASHPVHLPDLMVRPGELVLRLHLWNEQVPRLPPGGADLAWAIQVRSLLVGSLHAVAAHLVEEPHLTGVCAVGADTVLLAPGGSPGGARLVERLGFSTLPCHRPLGRFGEFWQNLYAWLLMWTYNAASRRVPEALWARSRCQAPRRGLGRRIS
jgi:hypothetical protein